MIHFEHPRFDFSDVLSVCAGAFGKRLMFQVFVDLYRLMFHEEYLFPIPPHLSTQNRHSFDLFDFLANLVVETRVSPLHRTFSPSFAPR